MKKIFVYVLGKCDGFKTTRLIHEDNILTFSRWNQSQSSEMRESCLAAEKF